MMERTQSRPIPSGRLNPKTALWISIALILSGSLLLFCRMEGLALGLGLFAVFWYNGVYTYLKRKTAFAVVPGGLIGTIPPILGWVCGGGALLDPRIWVVASFFFIWQVPHFSVLSWEFAKDYETAGLRPLTKALATEQLKRILLIWIWSAAASGLLIPLFHVVHFPITLFFLLALTFWLGWSAMRFFRSQPNESSLKYAFAQLNAYALLVICLLSFDRLAP